jgi:hypothetical protein
MPIAYPAPYNTAVSISAINIYILQATVVNLQVRQSMYPDSVSSGILTSLIQKVYNHLGLYHKIHYSRNLQISILS